MARKLTVQEIRKIIESEMGDAKRPEDVKVVQRPWWDVDGVLAHQVDWLKSLKLKEMFVKRLKK